MAMGPAPDGESMNWLSVSLPALDRAAAQARQGAPSSLRLTGPQETAASVLERFELPEATRRFIEDRLWAGATLIVSDNAASHETAPLNTDFVVLTR